MEKEADAIAKLMKTTPTEKERALIKKAITFAENAHKGQNRASGEPYIIHPIETAKNLARFGMGTTTICAGILHDTLEDTETTEDTLRENFGDDVAKLVEGVSKLGKLKFRGQIRHIESLRKLFIATADDIRVIIIKLADRLHNMETLSYIKKEKQKRIAQETMELHAPLANRLGMWKLKGRLEDLAFPYLYPQEAEKVRATLKQKTEVTERDLENLYKKLRKELAKFHIPVQSAGYRVKSLYSLWKKLKEKDMDIEKVFDIVALRVIAPTIEDCYRVLGSIHNHWRPLPGRIKDFIALPKPNGYQSIHTTVFTGNSVAEIQIRTPEMHERAEFGIAAHMSYKETQEIKIGLRKKKENNDEDTPVWIKEMKILQSTISEPDQFLKSLKMDFFKKRIFVFTPQGDVIDLPEGSCSIDFAYAIHSDIGDHVSHSKVNGKMKSITAELSNGDIVQIETSKNSSPTSKWLSSAKTALAKKQIKKYLDEHGGFVEKIKRAIGFG